MSDTLDSPSTHHHSCHLSVSTQHQHLPISPQPPISSHRISTSAPDFPPPPDVSILHHIRVLLFTWPVRDENSTFAPGPCCTSSSSRHQNPSAPYRAFWGISLSWIDSLSSEGIPLFPHPEMKSSSCERVGAAVTEKLSCSTYDVYTILYATTITILYCTRQLSQERY